MFKSGDLIFTKANDVLTEISSSVDSKLNGAYKVAHVGILYRHICFTRWLSVEMLPTGLEIVERELDDDGIAVLRVINDFNVKVLDNFITTIKDKSYSYSGLLNAGINAFIKFIFYNWDKKEIITNTESKFCSELVVEIYKSIGIDLGDAYLTTPADLMQKNLKIIKIFQDRGVIVK